MNVLLENALKNEDEIKKFANTVGQANIKVVGVGGAGNNMASWLHEKGVKGAEIFAMNTDQQHLNITSADKKFLIGENVTKGLGCGGFPEKGEESAREALTKIKDSLDSADMVFVCAGMGGGTGTGAAPVVAKVARDIGSIVIGVVTMPFKIERARIDKAEMGLSSLRQSCDTVIVIDNNRLVEVAGDLPIRQAFAVANELISTMIKGIVETIAIPSLVNLDFADVRAIMKDGGVAVIGVGYSDTNNKVDESVKQALENPLLDISYEGAGGALIHVHGGPDLTLEEINQIGEKVTGSLDDSANVIWGARVTDDMKGKVVVMTIITGVKSPWVLGKKAHREETREMYEQEALTDELGIEIVD
jgi:cell division protein FtsZ